MAPAKLRRSDPARSAPGDDAYDRLRALIVAGRIAPGTRLIETEFARRLHVSRTPVREAMRRLAHEGLAHVVGSGAKTQMAVAPVTRSDLIDLFAIIGALEGVAGRGVETLDRKARGVLAAELADQNAAFETQCKARPRDFSRFFAAHDAFHTRFVERCASDRLRHLVDAVRPQVKRYELIYAHAVGQDFGDSLREHRAIVAAFRSGDPDQTELAIRSNWSNSARRLAAGAALTPLPALGDYRAL
jgi:DNA-binding GntR family transcriptional regulator